MPKTQFQHFKRPESLFGLFARVTTLPGVGDKVAKLLSKKMGEHVIDLLRHLPVGIIDRSHRPNLASVAHGDVITIEAKVISHDKPPPRSRRPFRVQMESESGAFEAVFFHSHGNYVEKLLPIGEVRLISGRAERYKNKIQMPHPDHVLNLKDADSMPIYEAVYPLTAGLTPKILTKAMAAALAKLPELPEWIDEATLKKFAWVSWRETTQSVHAPTTEKDLSPNSPARARLAYDELLANQLALALVRWGSSKEQGRAFTGDGKLREKLRENLPFSLTQAQERVIAEIAKDQESPDRMLRLIQGDVGSGKTIVALMAMLQAVEAGSQAALLAPTEILARQHHASLTQFLAPLGIEPGILISKMKASEKKSVLEKLADGSISIVVGTHALLSETTQFHDLGCAVVDEQHRFGVRQRLVLGEKTAATDVLVMTATPIPRTLAMTAYGDLQSSVIDEKPPGRKDIKTTILSLERSDEVIGRLKSAIAEGKQVYWICPLVDESDVLDIAAAEERYAMLSTAVSEANPTLVHGRMDSAKRDEAMEKFRLGESKLLVATTVVEVGVDVPQASIMIIEHAERFGLAQMHQLRGRVGRGDIDASCLLLYKAPLSETALARLNIMRETNDGFRIAEEDLRLRGPGEVLGARQSGDPNFSLADLAYHDELLKLAREQVNKIIEASAKGEAPLQGDEGERLKLLLALFERDRAVAYLAGG